MISKIVNYLNSVECMGNRLKIPFVHIFLGMWLSTEKRVTFRFKTSQRTDAVISNSSWRWCVKISQILWRGKIFGSDAAVGVKILISKRHLIDLYYCLLFVPVGSGWWIANESLSNLFISVFKHVTRWGSFKHKLQIIF